MECEMEPRDPQNRGGRAVHNRRRQHVRHRYARSCRRRSGMPAAPPDRSEAGEAGAEQRDRRRLGHCGRKLGDHHLAVGGLEIRDQDLVCAGVEGAATTAGTSREHAAFAAAAAAVTATTASAESIAPAPTTAEAAAKRASCEIRERAAAAATGGAAAGAE